MHAVLCAAVRAPEHDAPIVGPTLRSSLPHDHYRAPLVDAHKHPINVVELVNNHAGLTSDIIGGEFPKRLG